SKHTHSSRHRRDAHLRSTPSFFPICQHDRMPATMRVTRLALFGLLLPLLHSAQALEWEDPEVIGIHKEAPHATMAIYADEATALAADREASPWFFSLNGAWRFHWVPRPEARPVD